MRQTLPKSIILRGYQSFSNVISNGVPVQGALLTGFLLTDHDMPGTEIGFSVPKKRVPLAAKRNRVRRLMREAVRKNLNIVSGRVGAPSTGAKIVLMFKGGATTDVDRLTLADLERDWSVIREQILKIV